MMMTTTTTMEKVENIKLSFYVHFCGGGSGISMFLSNSIPDSPQESDRGRSAEGNYNSLVQHQRQRRRG
eukprot:746602-Hanusia_phi.AAC.1